MKSIKSEKSYYILGKMTDTFNGYAIRELRKRTTINQQSSVQQYKIFSWQQLNKYCKTNIIDNDCKTISLSQTYEKPIKCIKKGDIAVAYKSGLEMTEILYIDKEPPEKIIVDETILIIRVSDTSIDPLYIYIMMCMSEPIQKGFRYIKEKSVTDKTGKVQKSKVPHISKTVLSNMLIRELPEDERKKIVKEYIKLHKAQDKFSKKISELQADKDNKANICWL